MGLSRVSVSFTENNLVPNAGLLPAGVLAQRIGLAEVVDERLRLAEHGASGAAKALTVIGSMLAGNSRTARLSDIDSTVHPGSNTNLTRSGGGSGLSGKSGAAPPHRRAGCGTSASPCPAST